ncbi:Polypeptide-transport-associated domain protein, FtsQ-type [Magnetococcus marinus MC-1]|uniref:Polypeptide-transport-associated domain protein, FtsQ-type n=1 Tax=Magnetococcus marinus (strain ATCC BAA-1437 / JCM 17883 / MC-1) TaxID=156889 RepID=A0L5M7_MAGMM|nr:FtsQ-type POTRA domain-containing protein [Magnetococcus marinus]ABK43270.1 Polypeptide-transport-associated domain protein, FtsQ-type [Magnetococcus marinus MC-1]
MSPKYIKGSLLATLMLVALGWGWQTLHAPGRFALKDVRVLGNKFTDVGKLRKDLGLDQAVNLLTLSPQHLRARLLTYPWVREARVERIFPGMLVIELEEKTPLCMTKVGEHLYLVDRRGERIKPLEAGDPMPLPVVSVDYAPESEKPLLIRWLIDRMQRNEWLYNRLSEAVGLPGGRWVLYTRKGVKLLHSARMEEELGRLAILQERYSILNRSIRQIDLRVSGQVVVKPQT